MSAMQSLKKFKEAYDKNKEDVYGVSVTSILILIIEAILEMEGKNAKSEQ